MQERELAMLAHVASQLIYRWLPPPNNDQQIWVGVRDEAAAAAMSETQWRELIDREAGEQPLRLPWLPSYLRRYDSDGSRLAHAVRVHVVGMHAAGAHYIVWGDADYPPALRQLPDPPLGLTLVGDPQRFTAPMVSIVGSRKASGFAAQESFALGRLLATANVVVVSGGAFGCDIAAHHGVLAAPTQPAPAICVFAGGLVKRYPVSNEAVFRRLLARRALFVSERLWAAPCRPADFAARNRIIAGLSRLTVVMQAAKRSGALVTARLALDYGADVAVLQHPEGDVRAAGSSLLLADGAYGFVSSRELFERPNLSGASL